MASSLKFKLSPNVRVIMLPGLSLMVFVILALATGNYGYKQIANMRDQIAEKKTSIGRLDEKLDILREVQETVLAKSDATLLAIPSKNSSLWTYLQIKSQLIDNNLKFEGITLNVSGTPTGTVTYSYTVNIETDNIADFINFIDSVYESAPRMFVSYAKVVARSGSFNIETQIMSYSAPLPTKIPALTEPIKSLSDDELQVLDKLTSLTPPAFTTLDPTADGTRINPFK